MKKNVFIWLIGFFTAITICIKGGTSLRAFAATDYYLEVSVLSASEAAAIDPSGTIHGGDYKVSFCVDVDPNAQKPWGMGLNYSYNSSCFTPITVSNLVAFYKKPSSQSGSWDLLSAGANENDHLLSILMVSTSAINFSNGEIVSMFLRPQPNVVIDEECEVVNELCIRDIWGEQNAVIPQTEYTPVKNVPVNFSYHDIHFIVGDLSGNGSINSNDHVYYLAILQNNSSYTESNISVLTSSDAPGLFVSDAIIGNQIIFAAGDVNSDGVINQQDANLIAQYCQDDLLGILTGNEYIGSEWIARFKLTATNGTITNIELDSIVPA